MSEPGASSGAAHQTSMPTRRRVYKACQQCRLRKLRCDLGDPDRPMDPPCRRCMREGRSCTFADSMKTGARRKQLRNPLNGSNASPNSGEGIAAGTPGDALLSMQVGSITCTGSPLQNTFAAREDPFQAIHLQTPVDALTMLASTAEACVAPKNVTALLPTTWSDFYLVATGIVSAKEASDLYTLYMSTIHPLFPLLEHATGKGPKDYVSQLLENEIMLATTILAIASASHAPNDLRAQEIHFQCGNMISKNIAQLVNGDVELKDISSVEALLLLAEYPLRFASGSAARDMNMRAQVLAVVRRFDSSSWARIGIAVRLAQDLSLEHCGASDEEPLWRTQRIRRTWSYCYNADRQIAVRLRHPPILQDISKPFWLKLAVSYGGVGVDHHLSEAYPEAVLGYILGTVQDSLFSNKSLTENVLKSGKFEQFLRSLNLELDGVRTGLNPYAGMNNLTTTLLHLELAYIQLYANALALRSLEYRLLKKRQGGAPSIKSLSPHVLYMSEGQYILEAIHYSKFLLTELTGPMMDKGLLAHCPARIFLWTLFAAAFLLKALTFGAIEEEQFKITELIDTTAKVLHEASTHAEHISKPVAAILRMLCATCYSKPTGTTPTTQQDTPRQPTASDLVPLQGDPFSTLFENLDQSGLDVDWNLGGASTSSGTYERGADEIPWPWLSQYSSDMHSL